MIYNVYDMHLHYSRIWNSALYKCVAKTVHTNKQLYPIEYKYIKRIFRYKVFATSIYTLSWKWLTSIVDAVGSFRSDRQLQTIDHLKFPIH